MTFNPYDYIPKDAKTWSRILPEANKCIDLGDGVQYNLGRCLDKDAGMHTVSCIWVFHYCEQIVGEPGITYGWFVGGISSHKLIKLDPLTINPSLYWPDCCGKHGYIREGKWESV